MIACIYETLPTVPTTMDIDLEGWIRALPPWGIYALLGAAALFGAWLLWRILRILQWVRMWNYRRVGSKGELRAEAILESAGYTILQRQVTTKHKVKVDGKVLEAPLRADLLVVKGGRKFVAEVKAGWIVSDPMHTATRRQLLEYEVAFGSSGVVLVDVPRSRVLSIEFEVT